MYAGIEAGGTKFNCIIAEDPQNILTETRIPTTTPHETLTNVIDFFLKEALSRNVTLKSLGIGSFGPLDLNKQSPHYGCITSTPKTAWQNVNIVKELEDRLHLPVELDTDVNAAALGELCWGAGQGWQNILYITIGTGIGGGAIIAGKPYHGLLHPEMGHIFLTQSSTKDNFKGVCPYHSHCFEGLASGPALKAQWGQDAALIESHHPAWDQEAFYIAQALSIYISILSPEIIILGGGVMQQTHLFPLIRTKVIELLNGYLQTPAILENIEHYIVPPGLGTQSGVLGAIALARSLDA
ncbi:MAG: ROK family protein [Chloroflexi bacterium]|nr:ROK family protein [Chloroflexota bacterium]